MVYENICGTIESSSGETYVEWKFPISPLLSKDFDFIDSPKFLYLNSEWSFRLRCSTENMIYIKIFGEYTKSDHNITYTIGFKDLKPIIKCGPKTKVFQKEELSQERIDICLKDDFKQRINKYASGDTLTVYCKAVSSTSPPASKERELYNTTSLSDDLQELLLTGRKSDVIIEVQDQAFKVHKLILEARSPVFSAMFENDMTEKNEGIVKIVDFRPDTFKHFLQCLYSGKIENLTPDNVISLYAVADKYCVNDIKRACLEFMEDGLCEDTACDVLVLADKYNESRLKEFAEYFLIQNLKSVIQTRTWEAFMDENLQLASKILMKAYQEENP